MARERLLVQHCLHLCAQTVEAPSHIRHAGSDPDLRSCRKIDHFRRLSRTVRKSPESAPLSTLIIALPGNSMWIDPDPAEDSSETGSRISGALGAVIVTGSKARGDTVESISSPRSKARRHLKRWLRVQTMRTSHKGNTRPGFHRQLHYLTLLRYRSPPASATSGSFCLLHECMVRLRSGKRQMETSNAYDLGTTCSRN